MILQLTSGIGAPSECHSAVTSVYRELTKEFKDIELLDKHTVKGSNTLCSSITFKTSSDLSGLIGTILWIGKSPFRPHHKRKNWYIACNEIPELASYDTNIKESDLKVSYFHCGGNGGQNVNKVETGVQITHIPTGIHVRVTDERSQAVNKKIAITRLKYILKSEENIRFSQYENHKWQTGNKVERGNPVRVFEGKLVK